MKKTIILMLCATLTMACSKDDNPTDDPGTEQPGGGGTGGEDNPGGGSGSDTPGTGGGESGEDERGQEANRPTDWKVTCEVDPTTSMTLTIEVEGLPQSVSSGDLMASFVGDECRGVTTAQTDYDMVRFYLPVARSLADDADNMPQVTVRYYCAAAGRIYTMADEIYYEKDGHRGSPSQPFKPQWK